MSFKQTSTTVMAYILAFLIIMLMLTGIGWFFAGNDLMMRSFFAPKVEQVKRETFETSKAYRDGMAQELRALQLEYIKAEDSLKPAMARLILHKAAGVPSDALPPDLNAFLVTLTVQANANRF